MMRPGSDLDAARARVVAHGLTAEAVGQLTAVVSNLSLEALAPVKQQLKLYFSDRPWTEADDEALADAVGGPAGGGGRHELESGLTLAWGWDQDRFWLRLESDDPAAPPRLDKVSADPDWDQTFDGPVTPEATPSPRTIRFATGLLHPGPSRSFNSAADAATEPPVARLFAEFDAVTSVLVGPDFVAVTLSRPDRWEPLLAAVLRVVTEGFSHEDADASATPEAPVVRSLVVGSHDQEARGPRQLERAWAELGALRAERPEDLEHVVAAARDAEPARRQVAAALLTDAPPGIGSRAWARLIHDPSRAVRRSVVDAVVGSQREELRPLLEQALSDTDAWVRWKALRGIAALGAQPSRDAIEAHATDTDFRVRLESARVLAGL
jgi:Scaffold protein Nfu/NifU N terminal/HEAT repeats